MMTENRVCRRINAQGVLALALGGTIAAACGGSSSTVERPPGEGNAGEAGQDGVGGGTASPGGTAGNGGAAASTAGEAGHGASPEGGAAGESGRGGSGGDGTIGGTGGQVAGRGGEGGAIAGGGGTAGTTSDGGGSGRAGSDGGGAAGASGEVGVLGGLCDPPGRLACAGNHQKLTLVCNQFGVWQQNETCDAGEFCASAAGADAGLCKTPDEDCAEREPDAAFCDGKALRRCDADGLASAVVEECQNECVVNACSDRCLDNRLMNCSDFCTEAEPPPVSCQEICGPGPEAGFPATELPVLEAGVEYQLWLPAVPVGLRCGAGCQNFGPGTDSLPAAFAFKMPFVEGALYRVVVDHPAWRVQPVPYRVGEKTCTSGAQSLALTAASRCERREWPAPSVGSQSVTALEFLLFVFPLEITTEPARLTIELGDETLADCPAE